MNNLREFVSILLDRGCARYNLVMGKSPVNGMVDLAEGSEEKIKIIGGKGTVTREVFVSAMVSEFIARNGFELNIPSNYISAWIVDKHLYLDVCRVDDAEYE